MKKILRKIKSIAKKIFRNRRIGGTIGMYLGSIIFFLVTQTIGLADELLPGILFGYRFVSSFYIKNQFKVLLILVFGFILFARIAQLLKHIGMQMT